MADKPSPSRNDKSKDKDKDKDKKRLGLNATNTPANTKKVINRKATATASTNSTKVSSASGSSLAAGSNLSVNNRKKVFTRRPSTASAMPIQMPPRTLLAATSPTKRRNSSESLLPSKKQKQNEDISTAKVSTEATPGGSTGPSTSAASEALDEDKDKDEDKDSKKKKNRCAECRKKVGLTGFQCRCGGLYCAIHRYSDKHNCTFNYKEHGAQEIRRNNPVVVGEKIQKI